jgi:hypothetical protein
MVTSNHLLGTLYNNLLILYWLYILSQIPDFMISYSALPTFSHNSYSSITMKGLFGGGESAGAGSGGGLSNILGGGDDSNKGGIFGGGESGNKGIFGGGHDNNVGGSLAKNLPQIPTFTEEPACAKFCPKLTFKQVGSLN